MPNQKSVDLRHAGGMQFVAAPSSGHRIAFDDRLSDQGGSPVETILAALGSCSAMDVISIAGKKRQAVDAYEIHVTGSQRDEYPQVFTEIHVVHELTGARPVGGRHPARHRTVRDQVLPGQRDALGRGDRRAPSLCHPLDRHNAPRGLRRGRRDRPVRPAGHPGGPALGTVADDRFRLRS